MPDTTALELFAEISIGLLGFAGVVSALGRSRLPPPTRTFRITALLLYSVVALGGPLLPIVLFNHGLSAMSVWLSSAIVLASAQAVVMAWGVRATQQLVRDDQLSASLAQVVFTIFIAAVLYLLYGIFFDRASLAAIYLVGVSFSLGLGVFHFVVLVVSIQSGDQPGSGNVEL